MSLFRKVPVSLLEFRQDINHLLPFHSSCVAVSRPCSFLEFTPFRALIMFPNFKPCWALHCMAKYLAVTLHNKNYSVIRLSRPRLALKTNPYTKMPHRKVLQYCTVWPYQHWPLVTLYFLPTYCTVSFVGNMENFLFIDVLYCERLRDCSEAIFIPGCTVWPVPKFSILYYTRSCVVVRRMFILRQLILLCLCFQSSSELVKLWGIGCHMWTRNFPEIYKALKYEWSPSIQPVITALQGMLQPFESFDLYKK